MAEVKKSIYAKVLKVSEELGLVFGWGIICTKSGEPYYDLGGVGDSDKSDHIPEPLMIEAATEFMAKSRGIDEMHDEGSHGTVVHSMPMTDEIAKAFGLTIGDTTGWMVAARPSDEILKKFVDGTYTGFSIGGVCERSKANG